MSGLRLTILVTATLLAALAAPAGAGQKADTPTVSELLVMPSKMASELDVVAKKGCLRVKREPDAPEAKVVATYPAEGALVRPGVLLVRITFATPMTCAGFFRGDEASFDPCPGSRQEMLLSLDRKTIWTLCRTAPHEHFGLWMDHEFISLAGRALTPFHLTFETLDGPLVTTPEEAVNQDPESAARLKH